MSSEPISPSDLLDQYRKNIEKPIRNLRDMSKSKELRSKSQYEWYSNGMARKFMADMGYADSYIDDDDICNILEQYCRYRRDFENGIK